METVGSYYALISGYIWDERIWFPPGVNWSTLSTTDHEKFPDFGDMYYPIAYSFVVLIIRTVFEWSIARPLGILCGIKDTSSELENVFQIVYRKLLSFKKASRYKYNSCSDSISNGTLAHEANGYLPPEEDSSQSHHDGPGRKRTKSETKRRLVIPKSTLDKFAESCWRFAYYFLVFFYGLYVLWDKPWFWDTAHCWYGYPFQTVDKEIWWYYMIESSFYWSLAISQFVDVHRKDFGMNFVHHVATILLLWFSWADNFVRIGTLVLVCHDAVDFIMEAAKMARYCKFVNVCNGLFGFFTIIWFITRLGFYPMAIIYSAMIEAPALVGFYAAYYIFNCLLFILQILHILWTIMILRIIINAIKSGEADDVRSDDEESDEDEVRDDSDDNERSSPPTTPKKDLTRNGKKSN